MAIILNAIILILQLISYLSVFREMKWKALVFYTQLSNVCAAIAAVFFFVLGSESAVMLAWRYTATCMLTLTMIVVFTILLPLGDDPKDLLWYHHGFLYHILTPILSAVSYIFFETHAPAWMLVIPLLVTFVYGVVMLVLNGLGLYEGPYPFLMVKKQSILATVVWMCILCGAIGAISAGLMWLV